MIRCCISVSLALSLNAVLIFGISSASYAQSNQPLRLAPAVKKEALPSDTPRTPRRTADDIANPRVKSISTRITGGAVQVDSLKAINSEEAGTLTPQTGALGQNMWSGTSRQLIEKLLTNLPTRAPSAAMRSLMRKLLLSPARVPEGNSDTAGLILARLEVLMAMGALEEAEQLIDALPVARAPELIVMEADLRLLANDNARACKLAEQEMANKTSNFWQKTLTFCQIIKGQKEKAELSLLLMRELGDPDEAFLTMAESLISDEPLVLPTLSNPTPLHLAMARVGKIELPGDVMTANTPSVLRAIALSPKSSIGLRLEAAERADEAGALPVDTLRQLYTSVEFSKEDLANPLSRAEVEFGPMVRALLYRTSLVQTVPTAQAEATARAFSLARDEGRYASAVHVFQPVLRRIPPSNQLLWFAPEAVRALLLAGDRQRAQAWYQVLQAGSVTNKEAAESIDRFRPMAKLFEFNVLGEREDEIAIAWWKASENQPNAPSKGTFLFSILQAMGVSVPEQAWEPLIGWEPRSQQTIANAGLLTRLRQLTAKANALTATHGDTAPESAVSTINELTITASANPSDSLMAAVNAEPFEAPPIERQRVGETVLLSLVALGDAGPANAEVGALGVVLSALSAAGLKDDARALALEAALANDL